MNNFIINSSLIEHLRTWTATSNIILDKDEIKEIVPKNLSHNYLLKNFNIDSEILNYYYNQTSRVLTEAELNDYLNIGFINEKKKSLSPYSLCIYGAYHSRVEIVNKLNDILYLRNVEYRVEGKKVSRLDDLIPYFKEYKNGFEDGFEKFERDNIELYQSTFGDKDNRIKSIYDFIVKNIFGEHCWLSPKSGFTAKTYTTDFKVSHIINGYKDGLNNGYFYKAWSLIFSNSLLFAPSFNKLKDQLKSEQVITKAERLNEKLSEFGFFELKKVKELSEKSKFIIIEKISESGLPYAIAMFDYLQFIQFLEKNYFDRKYKLHKEVSKWFDSDKEGRAVKGNISSLLNNTTENKNRYTAYKHKENVIKDYELLK